MQKGVSHYHFGAKAHSEMIVYTFLLPGKNDKADKTLVEKGIRADTWIYKNPIPKIMHGSEARKQRKIKWTMGDRIFFNQAVWFVVQKQIWFLH